MTIVGNLDTMLVLSVDDQCFVPAPDLRRLNFNAGPYRHALVRAQEMSQMPIGDERLPETFRLLRLALFAGRRNYNDLDKVPGMRSSSTGKRMEESYSYLLKELEDTLQEAIALQREHGIRHLSAED